MCSYIITYIRISNYYASGTEAHHLYRTIFTVKSNIIEYERITNNCMHLLSVKTDIVSQNIVRFVEKKNRKETIAVVYFCAERDRLMSTTEEGWKRPVL